MVRIASDGFLRRACRAGYYFAASTLALGCLLAPAVVRAQATTPGVAVVFLPPPPDDPEDDISVGSGISADGTTVGGYSDAGVVRWVNGVPELLDHGFFYTEAISGDGNTIVGNIVLTGYRPFIWTRGSGVRILNDEPEPGVTPGNATAVNSDGHYVVVNGNSFVSAVVGSPGGVYTASAYRWSADGGYQSLGQFGTRPAAIVGTTISWGIGASGISGDGRIITGTALDGTSAGSYEERGAFAFYWEEGSGLHRLPDLSAAPLGVAADTFGEANGISRDGSTIVGASKGADGLIQAVYWRGGQINPLGFIPGTNHADQQTVANAANLDGSVIVGGLSGFSAVSQAWRWTFGTGMQSLNEIARNAGLDLRGFSLTGASGISDNGQFILGNADNDATGEELAFIMQLAQITQTRLVVIIRLPGVTLESVVNQSFQTSVRGTLNGDAIFSRSLSDPITSTAGMQSLADARTALQAIGGLRRIVIADPRLVSIATTVASQTSNSVDVLTDVTVTHATVNRLGPATVITGDRGTCQTPAANGQDPTGCSLPGTPVAVSEGVLNSNVYTNSINTIVPTTTTQVNQLITSQWEVAATAGNQFGTVHALVGRVGFDRGDRLLMRALALGTADGGEEGGEGPRAGAATPAGSRLIGESGWRMFGEYFGSRQHMSADAGVPVARATGHTDGLTAGLGWGDGEALRLGAMVDYGKTGMDVRDPVAPERLDVTLTQIGAYGGWRAGRLGLSAAAAFGFGNVRTRIDAPGGASRARRDVTSWALGAGARFALIDGGNIDLSAAAGLRHGSVDLHRFTETGGTTPLAGLATSVTRTRLYAGLEASAALSGSRGIRPWAYARAAHDSGDREGIASVVFAANPALGTFQALGPAAGRWAAELGAGLDARLAGNLEFNLGYEGSFRDGENRHTARAGLVMAF